jgi:hypothetical protein
MIQLFLLKLLHQIILISWRAHFILFFERTKEEADQLFFNYSYILHQNITKTFELL